MLNLRQVKLNNTYNYYNFVDITSPSLGETFLSDIDDITFKIGYTYEYNGTTWGRIEVQKDSTIDIHSTLELVCESINNQFYAKKSRISSRNILNSFNIAGEFNTSNVYTLDSNTQFEDNKITFTDNIEIPFNEGDLVFVGSALRNSERFAYIETINGQEMTMGRGFNKDLDSESVIILSLLPTKFQDIVAKMIWFDTYKRDIEQAGLITSESEDNYSVSYALDGMVISGLQYPSSITNGLKAYKLVRFV